MAEWLCSGLQSRVRRFDSDPSLHFSQPFGPGEMKPRGNHLAPACLVSSSDRLRIRWCRIAFGQGSPANPGSIPTLASNPFSFSPPAGLSAPGQGVTMAARPALDSMGPGGEIGRRKGLKIPREQSLAGSSPAPGTKRRKDFRDLYGKFLVLQKPLVTLLVTPHSRVRLKPRNTPTGPHRRPSSQIPTYTPARIGQH